MIKYKNIYVEPQNKQISGYPEMIKGCSPGDNGNLLLSEFERTELLNQNQKSRVFIKEYYGADELVNSKRRYCLWITEENLELAYSIPIIKNRIKQCEEFRLKSKKAATRKKAATPYFFDERKYKELPSIIIPQTGSERREYLPLGILDESCVISKDIRGNTIATSPFDTTSCSRCVCVFESANSAGP